jgi:hypothetical protein
MHFSFCQVFLKIPLKTFCILLTGLDNKNKGGLIIQLQKQQSNFLRGGKRKNPPAPPFIKGGIKEEEGNEDKGEGDFSGGRKK